MYFEPMIHLLNPMIVDTTWYDYHPREALRSVILLPPVTSSNIDDIRLGAQTLHKPERQRSWPPDQN